MGEYDSEVSSNLERGFGHPDLLLYAQALSDELPRQPASTSAEARVMLAM